MGFLWTYAWVLICAMILKASGQTVPASTQIRLQGGLDSAAGRVEVLFDGVWGTVCDDAWDNNNAAVVCRMLGYNTLIRAVAPTPFPAALGVPIWLDDVDCIGTESDIANCPSRPWNQTNCALDHSEDAGVECQPNAVAPNVPTAEDSTPATITSCTRTNNARLSGGSSPAIGRVEIRHNNVWGTVCDDSFDVTDAQVFCSSLCYENSLALPFMSTSTAYPTVNDTVPIHLDEVMCQGTETSIVDCPHASFGVNDCSHKEDALVNCGVFTGISAVPVPIVTCEEQSVRVSFLRENGLTNDDITFSSAPVGCIPATSQNISFVTMTMPFYNCLFFTTSNSTHIVASATLLYHIPPALGSVITRKYEYSIPVFCAMARDSADGQPFQPIRRTVAPVWDEGGFTVQLRLFTDNTFSTEVSSYPLNIAVTDWLNVGVTLTTEDARLKMIVPNCIASPAADFSTPQYPLVTDNCPSDSTLDIFPINNTMINFRFQSFEFVSNSSEIYLRCVAFVCRLSEKSSQCDRTCNSTTESGRRRRDTEGLLDSGPFGGNSADIDTHHPTEVRLGPIFITDSMRSQSNSVKAATSEEEIAREDGASISVWSAAEKLRADSFFLAVVINALVVSLQLL